MFDKHYCELNDIYVRFLVKTLDKASCIGYFLRRNCPVTLLIEGKIQVEGRMTVTGRRGRREKQLLDDLREKRGYCKLKGEH
jgi:hypothetical protein